MSKQVIVVGTYHQKQKVSDAFSVFEKMLEHYIERYDVSVIIEEWNFDNDETVGKRIADRLLIGWCNAGTPKLQEFETYDPSPVWLEDSCETECMYGPIEAQIKRESYMVDKIFLAMNDHEVGLFVCGIAHLHSVSEKLHFAGYEVKGTSLTA